MNYAILIICAAAALVGAVCTAYQMFVMYLIGRRKYPVVDMTEERQQRINIGKRRALAGIVFLAAGAAGLVITLALGGEI